MDDQKQNAANAMKLETLLFDVVDGIATLTFNRPYARNAIDLVMRREIAEVVSVVNLDPTIRVLILMSNGGSFCAGGDVRTMQNLQPGAIVGRRRVRDNWSWIEMLIQLDRPVIAAVDGPAVGAGFNLALAADFIIATPTAYFCQSFAKVGLVSDMGGLYLLPRIVGLQRAKELVFSARRLDAVQALEMGIVYKIVESASLAQSAQSLARSLSKASPEATGLAKSILNNALHIDLRTALELEASANGICFDTQYHHQAVERFLAKQATEFSGVPANDEPSQRGTPKAERTLP